MDWKKILESLRPEGFENVEIVVHTQHVHHHNHWTFMAAPNYGFISFGQNFGNVQIYNQLAALENSEKSQQFGSALKELLAAIDLSGDLSSDRKQELLENVGALIQQAHTEKPARGVVRSAWHFIRDNIGSTKDLLEAADMVRKLIGPFFGVDP
jgi:hypothetical protein